MTQTNRIADKVIASGAIPDDPLLQFLPQVPVGAPARPAANAQSARVSSDPGRHESRVEAPRVHRSPARAASPVRRPRRGSGPIDWLGPMATVRSGWVSIFVCGAAVGALVMWLMSGTPPPETVAMLQQTPPPATAAAPERIAAPSPEPAIAAPPAVVVPDPPVASAKPAESVPVAPAPTPPAPTVAVPASRADTRMTRRRQTAARPTAAATAAAPAGTADSAGVAVYRGSIAVQSEPQGATVFVNGLSVGSTPMVIRDLPIGSRAVRIEAPGYQRWSAAVQVTANEQTRVTARLNRNP